MSEVYYHVTRYDVWPDVRAHGLRSIFEEARGEVGHVWLFTDPGQALAYSEQFQNPAVRPCIVVVRTDRAVPTNAGIPGAYWVEGRVRADEIYDVIRPDDLHHYEGDAARWRKEGALAVKVASEDYRGHHRAPTSADDVAAPFHDVEEMMPDYYEHPEYYAHDGRNSPVSRESEAALKAARGNPNAMVTIYRALPPGYTSINPGDWVTQSLTYARQHAVSNGGPDWPVITVQVPAKTLWTEGYICEWGYSGSPISARTATLVEARKVWYHGSHTRMEPGTAMKGPEKTRWSYGVPGKVYFTPDPWVAIKHVGGIGQMEDGSAYLYEVEPIGEIEDDPEVHAWGAQFYGAAYMADDAVVTKRYSTKEIYRLWLADEQIGSHRQPYLQDRAASLVTADLSDFTFQTSFRRDWDGERLEDGVGLVWAMDGDAYAGSLFWNYHSEPPVVTTVSVESQYQRQGIATRLWEMAKGQESRLVHDNSLTPDGRAWSQTLAKIAAAVHSEQVAAALWGEEWTEVTLA